MSKEYSSFQFLSERCQKAKWGCWPAFKNCYVAKRFVLFWNNSLDITANLPFSQQSLAWLWWHCLYTWPMNLLVLKAQLKTVTFPNAILGVALNLRTSKHVSLANVFLAKRQNGVVESPKRGPQSNCQQPQPQQPRTHFEQWGGSLTFHTNFVWPNVKHEARVFSTVRMLLPVFSRPWLVLRTDLEPDASHFTVRCKSS